MGDTSDITSGIQNLRMSERSASRETQSTISAAAMGADDNEVKKILAEVPDIKDIRKRQSINIKELKRENVRYWMDAMEEELMLQGAWKAIEQYQKVGKSVYSLILQKKDGWEMLDLKAKAIMKAAMSETMRLTYKRGNNTRLNS